MMLKMHSYRETCNENLSTKFIGIQIDQNHFHTFMSNVRIHFLGIEITIFVYLIWNSKNPFTTQSRSDHIHTRNELNELFVVCLLCVNKPHVPNRIFLAFALFISGCTRVQQMCYPLMLCVHLLFKIQT